MRSRFWCSCALAVALAGCGGSERHEEPYSYDASAPLGFRRGPVVNRASESVRITDVSFRGANGSVVRGFLLEPARAGKRSAALFLHGSGGSRVDLLLPAAQLAQRGVVTMTISLPTESETYRPLVVDARRALDVLATLPSAGGRVGLVGYSLGAQTAAIVAGVDERPRAVAILAGRGALRARQFLRRTKAALWFAGGRRDDRVRPAQLRALAAAAPAAPRIHWYDTGHELSRRAFEDAVGWLARELRPA